MVTPRRTSRSGRARQLREAALAAAGRGWWVFPLVPGGKTPAVRGWQHRATTDARRIERCWTPSSHNPGLWNIGLDCQRSGLVVVDLDVPKPDEPAGFEASGEAALARIAAAEGVTVPATYAVRTPSGGLHLYFTPPAQPDSTDGDGLVLGNTAGRVADKVDTRGRGGYVVAAGSHTEAGVYHPEPGSPGEVAELPGWLIDRLARVPEAGPGAVVPAEQTRRRAYLDSAVRGELARVLASGPDRHNNALFIASARLGQLVAGGHLDQTVIRAALVAAGQAVGQPEREARATVDSGLRNGATHPRPTTAHAGVDATHSGGDRTAAQAAGVSRAGEAARTANTGPAGHRDPHPDERLAGGRGPAPAELARWGAADRARIRQATADWAGHYNRPELGVAGHGVARYVAEAHLQKLVDAHGLNTVTDAVAAEIEADPGVLDDIDDGERQQRARRRQAQSQAFAAQAYTAYRAGEYEQALELVDQAELADPDGRPPGAGFDRIRTTITETRDQATHAHGADGQVSQMRHLDRGPEVAEVAGSTANPSPGAGATVAPETAERLARSAHPGAAGSDAAAHRRAYVEAGVRGLHAVEVATGDAEPQRAVLAQAGQLGGGGRLDRSTIYAVTSRSRPPDTDPHADLRYAEDGAGQPERDNDKRAAGTSERGRNDTTGPAQPAQPSGQRHSTGGADGAEPHQQHSERDPGRDWGQQADREPAAPGDPAAGATGSRASAPTSSPDSSAQMRQAQSAVDRATRAAAECTGRRRPVEQPNRTGDQTRAGDMPAPEAGRGEGLAW